MPMKIPTFPKVGIRMRLPESKAVNIPDWESFHDLERMGHSFIWSFHKRWFQGSIWPTPAEDTGNARSSLPWVSSQDAEGAGQERKRVVRW